MPLGQSHVHTRCRDHAAVHRRAHDHATNTAAQLKTAANNIDETLWQTIIETEATAEPMHHQQKQLTNLIRNHHTIQLTNTLDHRGLCVHLSTTGTGAGAWLHAPTNGITPLTNNEFATAAKIRLDKAHTNHNTICYRNNATHTCSNNDNPHLDHALSCKFGHYRNQRHNAIRNEPTNIIIDITGHRPLQEQLIHLTQDPQNDNTDTPLNRSDITFPTADTTHHIDVMVTTATTITAQAGAMTTNTPGTAAIQAERLKIRKYGSHPVTPAVVEAHRHFGPTLLLFLQQLSQTLPTAQEQANAYYHAIQRISTTLQRHNAQTIQAQLQIHTTPPRT